MNNFNPKIDTWWFGANVVEAPNIEYDQKEIKPWVIEQQKWDILYKAIVFITILFVIGINFFVSKIYNISAQIAEETVRVKDLEPVVAKIEAVTKGINYDNLVINRFMLENLFFVWDQNYEIIQKYKRFFEDPNVVTQLWNFQLKNISIEWNAASWTGEDVMKYPIKLEWSFSSFNKDVRMMISFLNNMLPIVVIEDVKFAKWNNVNFVWYILVMKKDLLSYEYWAKYKEINNIVKLKEEYEKNITIFEKVLDDKDINFKKIWITKIYNCDQYEKILSKQNIIKEKEIEQCKDVENLIKNLKTKIDTSFNSLIK